MTDPVWLGDSHPTAPAFVIRMEILPFSKELRDRLNHRPEYQPIAHNFASDTPSPVDISPFHLVLGDDVVNQQSVLDPILLVNYRFGNNSETAWILI